MGEDKRREPRVEAKLAIRLAFGTLDEFVERYALNLSRGGIFVRTRDPRPVGTVVTLDLQLATGERVVRGKGVVVRVTAPSAPGEPRRDPGMGIRFTELDAESRGIIERVVASRAGAGGAGGSPGVPDEGAEFTGSLLAPPAEVPQPQPVARVATVRRPAEAPATAPAAPADGKPVRRGTPSASRVVGIDLGTTNCCVAVAENGKARVIGSRQGWNTIPSVVAFDAHGRLLVGHPAKAQMVVNPQNSVYGSKRLVGRPFASPTVQACRDRFFYDIVEGERGEAAVRFAGREFTLQQVAAFLLSEIRQVAARDLNEEIGRAVITVPAYYNDHQRQAVREAGALAGLEMVRIVNEPTAAALAYGYGRNLDERVLVYDLGGGTFDASVLEIRGDVYQVLSTGGDTFLGGVDFDSQLVDHLAWRFAEENGFTPPPDRQVWQRIRDAAEETKVALSARESAVAHVPYLCKDADGRDAELRVDVTRADLEELTARLVERTLGVCREVLAAKGLAAADLDEVLLVGGQSRMPRVWNRVREELGREPSRAVHPDEAVALGAALLAESGGRVDSVVLIDVLGMGIGVGLPGGRMMPVIPRNTPLPVRKRYEVSTVRDRQAELELAVFQGDSSRVAECEYLGTLRLSDLPPRPRGGVRMGVEFALGQEGILTVTARDLATGRITEARFATSDTPESLRGKLQMVEPPAAPPGARPDGPAGAPGAGPRPGLLRRLLGRS